MEQDKLVGKMAKDLGMLREEITSLRAKIKALEEGQMTVDNLKLTKQLDGEREEFNRERASVLKKFAEKSEKLDLERARLMEDIKKREAEIQRMKAETEDEKQKLQVAKLEIDEARAANERTSKELDDMELILRNKTKDLEKQIIEFAREKEELKEYAGELDSMKEKLMKERDNIVQEKAKLAVEIENAKNESKLIQDEKADWEKKKERDGRDLAKKNQELETREERLGRDARDLESKKEELQISKNGVENDKKEVAKMKEELEEHNIALWTDRNKLNQEVREFLEDKKVMESDMKWQRTELEEAAKGLQKEKDELDQERREMNEYQESLEQLKLELEARERKLMHDQEDFYKMKKSYLDKILEGGNYEQMTPEMRKMAEDMGINVEEMIEEGKKLHERRSQLEKLKLDNDQHLAKIKELNKRNTSNSQSRRASFTKIPSGLESPNSMAGAHARKAAVKDYITGLYEMASTKQLMKEFDEKKQEVVKAREELDFSKKIIEKLRTDNKAVKRELDIATKIMEEMRAGNSNIDLNKLLGRSQKEASMQTDGAIVDGGIVTVMNQEYNEMQERIRDLEHKLRRKDLTDKVQTRAAASEEGDLDDPAAIKEIDRELQE